MAKKCLICGEIKNLTFNCCKCGNRICLNCYNFVLSQCFDCVTVTYGEKYKGKIEEYAQE